MDKGEEGCTGPTRTGRRFKRTVTQKKTYSSTSSLLSLWTEKKENIIFQYYKKDFARKTSNAVSQFDSWLELKEYCIFQF